MSISTTPGTEPNLHLTRRGKLVIATLIFILLAVCLTIVGNHLAGREAVATENQLAETYQQIVVQPGDTLWGIAVRASQQTDHNETLDRIVAYNDLESSELEVGQTLYIPVTR
jgi:LysM repeat protein